MNNLQSGTYVDVSELPKDLKRVLKVQFREFIHFVEDAQDNLSYYGYQNTTDRNREAA